jgi:hypothetical protein
MVDGKRKAVPDIDGLWDKYRRPIISVAPSNQLIPNLDQELAPRFAPLSH